MKIRKATKRDLEEIYKVMKKVRYTDFVYKNKSKTQILKDLTDKFKKRTYIVAIEDNKIIGYSIFTTIKNEFKDECLIKLKRDGYIYSQGIGLDPEYQGKGYGKKLKIETINIAKRKNYRGMYADVSSKNKKSLRLQRATGFNEITRFKDKKRKPGEKTVLFLKEFE